MDSPTVTMAPESRRRIVLVDFDWEDADLIPELLQRPGISVRLVAGSRSDDAGVRLAELCGLPRTIDLADLTREIFDLALVSERSPRRTQIEGLLLALGTPSLTPQSFFSNGHHHGETTPAVEAPLELHAAALETALGGEEFDRLVEQALPDISDDAPTSPAPVTPRAEPRFVIANLEDFPSCEDRHGLETALRGLMENTGAERAELVISGPEDSEIRVELGPEDALLRGLIELAQTHGAPQVVLSVAGSPEGTAWGAWPFRTAQHRGVVAAGGINPEHWAVWEKTISELRTTWDQRDRAKAGPAFPMVPSSQSGWVDRDEFLQRVELSIERNSRDGLRFAIHRLGFPVSNDAVTRFGERLPGQLRDTDTLCLVDEQHVLLLTATPNERFPYLHGRITALWNDCWVAAGLERPVPGVAEERCEMSRSEESAAFVARAREWLLPA
jgi:hypothetical protein